MKEGWYHVWQIIGSKQNVSTSDHLADNFKLTTYATFYPAENVDTNVDLALSVLSSQIFYSIVKRFSAKVLPFAFKHRIP